MKRLAIVTTHPVQYNAPLFIMLQERNKISLKVFYTWQQAEKGIKFDPGFGKKIDWDIPLLDGYDYCFVKNTAAEPGSHHFSGIINPGLNDAIIEWNADAVLVFGWSFKSHLQCIRFFHGKIPVLFRGDSTLLDEKPGLRSILRRISLKWVYRHIDHALYVGQQNKAYFTKHGLKNEQLVFAPHAIDNSRFADRDNSYHEAASRWRIALGIAEEDIVFLFAGKLEPKKNIELLITAFSAIKPQGGHLIIVGNGPLEKKLKENYLGRNNIHFLNFQNQSYMPVVYNLCDVFVLPSKGPGETWGLAVNEAMAASRSVIVSDKCGCAVDLIDIGKNGYVFESGNEVDLVEKMKLMLNKKRTKKMGEHSKFIIQDWSMEKVCTSIEQIVLINC